jgi:hypothetical protein
MLAVAAMLAFFGALLLHLTGGGRVTDWELAGLILLAAHLAFAGNVSGWLTRRPPGQP